MTPPGGIFSRFMVTYRDKQEPENLKVLARLYWHMMLSVVFGLIILVIAYGAFILYVVFFDEGGVGSQTLGKPTALITQERMSDVLEGFETRQARFDALKSDTSMIPDPSK